MALLELHSPGEWSELLKRASKEQREAILPQLTYELHQISPVAWGKDKLGEHWWSKQREIAESVRDNRRTAVPSAHGVGKSFIVARIASWWLDTHEPGDAFVATSAPTFAQVRAILWREINKAHKKGKLIGRVNQTEWLIGNELVGFGRKPANPAEEAGDETITAFQGIHAKYVLVVLDEACGIPESLWNAALSLITNTDSHICAIGNPDDPASHFEKVCRADSGWSVIPISIFDSPNFTDEEVPDDIRSMLPSQEWVEDAKKDFGEGTAVWTAKVLGQFPKDASDAVIPYSWAAQCKWLEFMVNADHIVTLGVDVGAGMDESVITAFQSNKFMAMPKRENASPNDGSQWRSRHDDPMKCVGEIISAIRVMQARRVNIDAIGVGWAVAGRVKEVCEEKGWDVDVNAVKVSESAAEKEKYANLRAELWWRARLALHGKQWDIGALDDQCLAELTTPKWRENSSGLIEVEKTEKIRERLGRSPDNASSALLAAFVPPKNVVTRAKVKDKRLARRR